MYQIFVLGMSLQSCFSIFVHIVKRGGGGGGQVWWTLFPVGVIVLLKREKLEGNGKGIPKMQVSGHTL